jgi:membrane dipeptidase
MNHLGMVVDISHVSDETFWDTIEISEAPVIASHSGARAIADHPRNMSDNMIRAGADSDGVVMVNYMTFYADPRKVEEWQTYLGWYWFTHPRQPETPLSYVIDHIDHVVQVGGIDHVGLGSDFDGAPFLPEDLQDVGDLPNITVELLRRGYSDEDIRKVLGGNVLRVLADVEAVAADLSEETGG